MRTKTPLTTIIACLVTSLFVAPGASAEHCTGTVTVIEAASQTVYVLQDDAPEDGALAVHVYLESNGQPSLQEDSGGPVPDNPLLIQAPLCIPSPDPDLRIV